MTNASACPRCRAELPAGARFCPQCGASQAAAAANPPGERRQVAVLFADLSGYTALSNELDAEEVHRLLSRYFELVDALVESNGGTVDKHIGDAVMGVFGAPIAHGNDTLRALRAAVGVHSAMEMLSAEFGRPLAAHVGVASGEVVAADTGSAVHSNYTVTGDAVNVAARLNELARARQTVISDDVYRACLPSVEADDTGAVPIRGFAGEMRVWRLRGLIEAAATATPLIGRDVELARFRLLQDALKRSGVGATCLLRADPGMGKTRLAEALLAAAAAAGCDTHYAAVLDFGAARGRDAAHAVFASLHGVAADASAAERREAVDRAVADGRLPADDEPFAADLMAILSLSQARYEAMDNEGRTQGKLRVLGATLERAAAQRPVAICIEDVHWASAWVLACIDVWSRCAHRAPCLLVLTTRREGDPMTAARDVVRFDLPPLGNADALALARTYLEANPDVAVRCVERAQGNPLFLTQLLRSGADGAAIPGSIQSVVLARLDRLAPADKSALQAASVIGQRFGLDALRHLLADPSYDATTLVERDLVRREAGHAGRFIFVHALIRDGAYASLLHSVRRSLHLRAAEWYGTRDASLYASHLDRAEDARAAAAYLDAARGEAGALRFDEALRLLRRGAELPAGDDVRCGLAMLEGELCRDLGDAQGAIAAFERALPVAHGDRERCAAWVGIAAGYRVTSTMPPAFEALDRAQALAEAGGMERELARIHYLRGNLHFAVGDAGACQCEHEQALHYARRAGDAEAEAQAQSGLGDAYYAHCRMLSAHDAFSRCVAICEREGLTRFALMNHAMIAIVEHWLGRCEASLARLARASADARALRHRLAETMIEEVTGWILVASGRREEATVHLTQSLAIAREIGARRYETMDLILLARACGRDDRAKARELLGAAWKTSAETGHGFSGAIVQGALACCAADAAERAAALQLGESLLREGSLAHSSIWFYRDAIAASLDAGAWDDADRYADRLAAFMQAEPVPWTDLQVALARALTDAGRGRPDHAALAALRDRAVSMSCLDEAAAIDAAIAAAGAVQ